MLRWQVLMRRIQRLRRRLARVHARGAPDAERLRLSHALDRLVLVAMRRMRRRRGTLPRGLPRMRRGR